MAPRAAHREVAGLPDLRRAGAVTELLFLYECLTRETPHLRPIADRLGLTVQAASHIYQQLRAAGRVEVRGGRYRPTVSGVAWLHSALGSLRQDLDQRWSRLNVIRSCRAVARERLAAGVGVILEMRDGKLTARRGSGPSRGRTLHGARKDELVEVGSLEGIVPVEAATVDILSFPEAERDSARVTRALLATLPAREGLLAAFGLEAVQLLARSTERPFVRFGVAAATAEAARVGVPATVVVREEELPRLLAQYDGPSPPRLTVQPLALHRRRRTPNLVRHRRSA